MGNSTSKVVNDIGSFIGTALAAPFKSLLGRSCPDVCVGIWDVVCFIEHICIADLIKFLLVCCLSYICLVFLYMLYKLGLCQCIAKTSCKMCWAACETSFLALDYICCFCWHKIRHTERVYRGRRRHHRRHRHLNEDVEIGYARTNSASSTDYGSVVYRDNVGSSIVGRKRKCRRKRRRKMKDGRSVRMNKRQVSVHIKGKSMKRSSGRRRKNQFKHKQLSNLSVGGRSNTMKFKRQRTR